MLYPSGADGGVLVENGCKAFPGASAQFDAGCTKGKTSATAEACKAACAAPGSGCDSLGCQTYFDLAATNSFCTEQGTFGDGTEDALDQCQQCTKGKWSSLVGLTSDSRCAGRCPRGTYGDMTGLKAATQCKDCAAGKWSNRTGLTAGTACVDSCSLGKWSAIAGLSSDAQCDLCAKGTFGQSVGFTSNGQCTRCARGKFSAISGRLGPCLNVCPVGKYASSLTGQSSEMGACDTCPSGKRGISAPQFDASLDDRCASCAPGRYQNQPGFNGSVCALVCAPGTSSSSHGRAVACETCAMGSFASGSAMTACSKCELGFVNPNLAQLSCATKCAAGRFSDKRGASSCSPCDRGRFATTEGSSTCERCKVGRFNAASNATTEASCTFLGSGCPRIDQQELHGPVRIKSYSSFLGVAAASLELFKFGDQIALHCKDGTPPQEGPNVITCNSSGAWEPDPRLSSPIPTRCTAQYCLDQELPPASSALVLYANSTVVVNGAVLNDLKSKQAPMHVAFSCDASAQMLRNATVYEIGHSIDLHCDANGGRNELNWVDINRSSLVDFASIRCLCGQGFKQGEGELITECVACSDGTYAPLNAFGERTACRACPFDGVSCNDAILVIREDMWFDRIAAAQVDEAGNFGITSATKLYKCGMRDACILNKTAVPMTMYCDENHTSVMCERCHNRHVECGRVAGSMESCVQPGYFDRGREWMFFAKVARHCFRCPAGGDAAYAYAITSVVAVGILIAIALLVVFQLRSIEQSVADSSAADQAARTANSSGPIARLLLNWLQATALLSAVKMTPPQEVQDASVFAEYAQGFSVQWFPIKCTLRWSYYMTFSWNLCYPLVACLFPALLVLVFAPLRKSAFRLQTRIQNRVQLTPTELHALKARRALEIKEAEAARRLKLVKLAAARGDPPPMFEDETSHTDGATNDDGADDATVEHEELVAVVPDSSSATRGVPSTSREYVPRRFDSRFGFFHNISRSPIRIRCEPSSESSYLRTLAIEVGAVVRAEELEGGYIRIAGSWGSGWVSRECDARGETTLCPINSARVVLSAAFDANSIEPQRAARNLHTHPGGEKLDGVAHRFNALCALNPEVGISLDVIQHVMPVAFEAYQFMRAGDVDGDGVLSFEEYCAVDTDLVANWRFGSVWPIFALADDDQDGALNAAELFALLPLSVGRDDTSKWMARYDKSGQHDVITLADFTALEHAVRKDDRFTVIGASLTMAIYLSYIKTAKGVMAMFSVEKIEGVSYLKRELGTLAFTQKHDFAMAVGAIYGLVFVFGIPIAALYTIFLNRHRLEHRRIRSTFGFLFEGYRPKMFFWEFVVLLRKIMVLAVALFWDDAFLQSVVAMFVLIVSIVVHMACWPYEEAFLNIAELFSLLTLFTLVLLSVLLWYARLRSDYLVLYEIAVTFILFVMYGALGIVLVGRVILLELRERSAKIVRAAPFVRPFFQKIIEWQEWIDWNVSGLPWHEWMEEDRVHQRRQDQFETSPWTFMRTQKEEVLKETKLEFVRRLWQRRRGGEQIEDVEGGVGNPGLTVNEV